MNKVTVREWWRSLQADNVGQDGDRAALAKLRRCTAPVEAATVPATLALMWDLEIRIVDDDARNTQVHLAIENALAVAIVLAHVRTDDALTHPARRLAEVRMHPLRFSRLLQAETPEERILAFRRAVVLADRQLDVGRLALAVIDWPQHRVNWAFQFHTPNRLTTAPSK